PAPDASERRGCLDGAYVPYVHAAASERAAHRRLRHPGSNQETLQEAQNAQAGADGEDREGVGAIPQRSLLVSVAESGYQDNVRSAGESVVVQKLECRLQK